MPLSLLNCPLCGVANKSPDWRANRLLGLLPPFGVAVCAGCGLGRLDPMPTDEEYRKLYEAGYFAATDIGDAPSWLSDYPPIPYAEALTDVRISAYRARLERLAAVFPDRGTLLDVGLATGEFATMALADGWKVTGIDISSQACKQAVERGINAHCGDLLSAALEDRSFDVVHLHHVFEHFTDPRAALPRLASFLAPKSLLIIEVPSQFDSWTRRIVNSIRLATGRLVHRSVLSIHHPFFYSRKTIASLLRQSGTFDLVWCLTYFPERWRGPAYRQALRLVDFAADRVAGKGENIEIAARLRGGAPS